MNRSFSASLFAAIGALFLSTVLGACIPAAGIPIETVSYPNRAGADSTTLLVFLPGRGDAMKSFTSHGIVDAVRRQGLNADLIAADVHLGYYREGTVLTRIKHDIVDPARTKGYKHIWLVGTSLGGYGSLLYASRYPDDVEGVVLLGPFLGKQEVIDDIRRAGGIRKWHPHEIRKNTEDEWDKHLWLWIKDNVEQEKFRRRFNDCGSKQQFCAPRIYLGYGRDDRFCEEQTFLASLMPPAQVKTVSGGHTWRTWKELWNRFLNDGIFDDDAAGKPARREGRE
jgi:pimeloyl-ACP methyl ester carboxylesterase